MALIFHDGFEIGGADAWSSVTGTPSFIKIAAFVRQEFLGNATDVFEDNYAAQTFTTPANSIKLNHIGFYCSYIRGSPANLEIALQGVNGSSHPDNSDITVVELTSAQVDEDVLTYVDITEQTLSANTQYAIVFRQKNDGGSTTDRYTFQCSASDELSGGAMEETTDGGSTWVTQSSEDMAIFLGLAPTGNYGMRCNASGSAVYASYTVPAEAQVAAFSFYLYINSLPDSDVRIFGNSGASNLVLTTAGEIDLYDSTSKVADGTTQLDIGQWYRISGAVSGVVDNSIWIDGDIEHNTISADADFGTATENIDLGVCGNVTADLYFDDAVFNSTLDLGDLGDIRVLAARPTAQGTDDDAAWQQRTGGSDTTNDFSYADIAEDPPDTDQGGWSEADGTANYQSIGLDDCGSGNLADIGGSDTIEAVNFMYYYQTGGGGTGDYAHTIWDESTRAVEDWTSIDDPKDPAWFSDYHADTPKDSEAWSQSHVNGLEMGMACQDNNKDMWWYETYAMIAYKVVPTAWIPKIILI